MSTPTERILGVSGRRRQTEQIQPQQPDQSATPDLNVAIDELNKLVEEISKSSQDILKALKDFDEKIKKAMKT